MRVHLLIDLNQLVPLKGQLVVLDRSPRHHSFGPLIVCLIDPDRLRLNELRLK